MFKNILKFYFLVFLTISVQESYSKESDSAKNSSNFQKETKNKSQNSKTNSPKIKTLEELLKKIKEDHITNKAEFKKREAYFLKKLNEQQALLKQATADLNKEEQILKKLQEEFEKQDQQLNQLEEKLALTMGALGELFGVVKQTAGETKALFQNSVVSAEYPGRTNFIQKISAKKNLPSTNDLETLWFLIQQEIIESGKITRFKKEIIKTNGTSKEEEMIRVGSFNLVSKGKYLIFDSETQRVIELVRQPKRRFLSLAKKLEKGTKEKAYKFALDPSRGSLLALLIQTPNLFERTAQGGIIGFLIIFLFLYGLILTIKKYLHIKDQEKLFSLQMKSENILKNNPLGEIMQTFSNFKEENIETLELKMEEAILQKTYPIKKGLGTIKLLSGISPLLGLLGTVTGMITTFQSITLFGTGDPKLMAGGISQALVTTALGLITAIPLIFIYNFLSSKANHLIQFFEEQALGMLSKKYNKSN